VRVGRRTAIAALVVGAVVVAGIVALASRPGSSDSDESVPAAHPGRSATVWVAPDGDDGSCAVDDRSRPCAGLNRAYELARCGDRVEIAPGTYPEPQRIEADPSKESCGDYVRFRGHGRARFTGDWTWAGAWISVSNVEIDGAEIEFETTADHARLVDSRAYEWITRGTDHVTLARNVFDGRYEAANNEVMQSESDETDGTADLTITGNTFKRYDPRVSGNHSEAIFIGGWTNGVLIQGNTFTDNGTTGHLFFTWWGGDQNDPASYPRNICVRGNHFDLSHNGYYDIQYREEFTGGENIDVEPPPSNTLGRSLKGYRTKLQDKFLPRACSPYPPF
jgi:hypothetical protein